MEEAKPTYEQLEWKLKDMEHQRNDALEKYEGERSHSRRLQLILKGMVVEQFHLNITLSPEIFTKDAFQVTQVLLKNYAERTAYEIEEKLGKPLRQLQECLMHINYLENHARNMGVQFAPLERRACDKWLYY